MLVGLAKTKMFADECCHLSISKLSDQVAFSVFHSASEETSNIGDKN